MFSQRRVAAVFDCVCLVESAEGRLFKGVFSLFSFFSLRSLPPSLLPQERPSSPERKRGRHPDSPIDDRRSLKNKRKSTHYQTTTWLPSPERGSCPPPARKSRARSERERADTSRRECALFAPPPHPHLSLPPLLPPPRAEGWFYHPPPPDPSIRGAPLCAAQRDSRKKRVRPSPRRLSLSLLFALLPLSPPRARASSSPRLLLNRAHASLDPLDSSSSSAIQRAAF